MKKVFAVGSITPRQPRSGLRLRQTLFLAHNPVTGLKGPINTGKIIAPLR